MARAKKTTGTKGTTRAMGDDLYLNGEKVGRVEGGASCCYVFLNDPSGEKAYGISVARIKRYLRRESAKATAKRFAVAVLAEFSVAEVIAHAADYDDRRDLWELATGEDSLVLLFGREEAEKVRGAWAAARRDEKAARV